MDNFSFYHKKQQTFVGFGCVKEISPAVSGASNSRFSAGLLFWGKKMPTDLRENLFRWMHMERVCLHCGKVFQAWQGFCSEHDGVIACSIECVDAWRNNPLSQESTDFVSRINKPPAFALDGGSENSLAPSELVNVSKVTPRRPVAFLLLHGKAGAINFKVER